MGKDKNNDVKNEMEEAFEEATDVCEACGGPLKAEKINLEEFEGGKLYLLENVVAYICEECGETWVPEPVLKEFENMMQTAKEYHAKDKPKYKKLKKRK